MLASEWDLKMHARNLGVSPPPDNRGPTNHLFLRFRNLTATLTAYIFVMKDDERDRINALEATMGLLYHLKMWWTLVHKRLKIGPPFYHSSINSAFYFVATLRRRRSANGSQPNFANKRWTVGRANSLLQKSWVVPPVRGGAKNFIHLYGFWRELMGNIF